jgi:hypothetical protein
MASGERAPVIHIKIDREMLVYLDMRAKREDRTMSNLVYVLLKREREREEADAPKEARLRR